MLDLFNKLQQNRTFADQHLALEKRAKNEAKEKKKRNRKKTPTFNDLICCRGLQNRQQLKKKRKSKKKNMENKRLV